MSDEAAFSEGRRLRSSRAPGLRLQILLALGGILLLAFVPLFFAVASSTTSDSSGSTGGVGNSACGLDGGFVRSRRIGVDSGSMRS